MRLGEFIEAGTPPNVVMMQITNLDKVRDRTDSRAINLLRTAPGQLLQGRCSTTLV